MVVLCVTEFCVNVVTYPSRDAMRQAKTSQYWWSHNHINNVDSVTIKHYKHNINIKRTLIIWGNCEKEDY